MISVSAAIILDGRKVLLAQRPMHKHQGGKWEFPGGKVENGETPEEALIRECKEEIGIVAISPTLFDSILFDYPEKQVSLQFYLVKKFDGQPKGIEGQKVDWFNIEALGSLSFPEANLKVVESLMRLEL
ncbi:MAG: 8-oxo-dGTP diphosphatase MutT [Gammaproteobacteria bacterium]|nr:8-oxo-dGTP diphosphatase MutT [Gammaproteobacteria bacterium]